MTEQTVHQAAAVGQVAVPAANGAGEHHQGDFLSLKHWLHMVLTVVVASLAATGLVMAFTTWSSSAFAGTAGWNIMDWLGGSATGGNLELQELYVTAALFITVPLLWLFDRRARVGLAQRPDYAQRAAYRIAVYGALGVLVVLTTVQVVGIVWVLLSSLALIGLQGADYKFLFLAEFLPALLSAVIFAGAAWYVWMLAKGRDKGALMALVFAVLGFAMAITLLITAIVHLHKTGSSSSSSTPSTSAPSSSSSSGSGSSDYGSGSSSTGSDYGSDGSYQ